MSHSRLRKVSTGPGGAPSASIARCKPFFLDTDSDSVFDIPAFSEEPDRHARTGTSVTTAAPRCRRCRPTAAAKSVPLYRGHAGPSARLCRVQRLRLRAGLWKASPVPPLRHEPAAAFVQAAVLGAVAERDFCARAAGKWSPAQSRSCRAHVAV